MEDLLQQIVLDNTLGSWLCVAGAILFALLIRRLISRFLAGKLMGLIGGSRPASHRKFFLTLVLGPMDDFLLVLVTILALDRLNFPMVLHFSIFRADIEEVLTGLAWIIMVILFIRLCVRVLDFFAGILQEKSSLEEDVSGKQLIVFFKDFFKVLLVLIGMLLILKFAFNRHIGSLLTGLSIVGAAVALATRESLENLIASFIIFFDKPFVTGDLVKVQGFTGTIEKIGLRSTRIRTDSKTYISVPNKQMVDSIVDNVTLRTQRKVELHLEIGLSATAGQLKQLADSIRALLQEQPDIQQYFVFLGDTGRNAHVLTIEYFTRMPQPIEAFNSMRETVNLAIIEEMEKNKMELAARAMDVVVSRKQAAE